VEAKSVQIGVMDGKTHRGGSRNSGEAVIPHPAKIV
jgi:hypothetical protein